MGRKGGGSKKSKSSSSKKNKADKLSTSNQTATLSEDGYLWVDPCRIRFQHSKIRPYFSGCGRSIYDTLDSIRDGTLSPLDLPPIMVIVGPTDDNDKVGPWYFSLNNRRLWVLKRCREEGLLEAHNNLIKVRVRVPKSAAEAERYSVANCALEAKVMKESNTKPKSTEAAAEDETDHQNERDAEQRHSSTHSSSDNEEVDITKTMGGLAVDNVSTNSSSSEESSDDESQGDFASKNPFSALM